MNLTLILKGKTEGNKIKLIYLPLCSLHRLLRAVDIENAISYRAKRTELRLGRPSDIQNNETLFCVQLLCNDLQGYINCLLSSLKK